MILISAFWGRIGPLLIASLMSQGPSTDKALSLGGTITAAIILLGAPSSRIWGVVADKKGRSFAIIVARACSVAGEIIIGYRLWSFVGAGRAVRRLVLLLSYLGRSVYQAGLVEMVSPGICGVRASASNLPLDSA